MTLSHRLSLRAIAFFFAIALLLITGAGGMLAAHSFLAERNDESLREEAQREGSLFVWLAEQFFSSQPDLVRAALMRHALEQGELATALLDEHGQVLLASRREWEGAAGTVLPGFRPEFFAETVRRRSHAETTQDAIVSFYIAWRIADAPKERWGALYLAYDKRPRAKAIAFDLWRREGVVVALAILLTPLALLVLHRFALDPLARLHAQLEELIQGGRQRVVPSGAKEIVALGEAIDRLSLRLTWLDRERAAERALFADGPVALFLWQADSAWTILDAAGNLAALCGAAAEALRGQSFVAWLCPTERERLGKALAKSLAARSPYFVAQYSLCRADGARVWVESHHRLEYDDEGRCQRIRGFLIDITATVLGRQREEIYRQSWLNLREAILVTDAAGMIEAVNPAFTAITGYSEAEAVGKTPQLLKSGLHDADFYADLWRQLKSRGLWSGYIWNKRKNGELFMAEMSIAAVAEEAGQAQRYIALFSDATPLHEALEKAEWSATHDRLTGLVNRSLFLQRLSQLCGAAADHFAAVLVIDLLRFRDINDSHGESVGNHLLAQIAGRLELHAPAEALVARLGSDEFALLLPSLSTTAEEAAQRAFETAKNMQREAETPVPYDALEPLSLRAAVGIRLFRPGDPSCRMEADGALLAEAHLALIEAKAAPDRIAFFERKLSEAIHQRVKTEQELRVGITAGQLRLHLQPQRDRLRRICGFEALVRWQHPEKGLLSPGAFFAAAETGGLLPALDDWMLSATLALIAAAARTGQSLTIACNLSPLTFDRGGVAEKIEEKLAAFAVPAASLVIELTEGALFRDEESVARELERIAGLGIRIAIDDFGTGYSNLARLHSLPIHELKIDRRFISQLPTNAQAEKLVRTLIELADSMALTVIAEGVEIEAQAEYLDALAPMLQQGYFHGKPAPAQEWLALLPPGEGKH